MLKMTQLSQIYRTEVVETHALRELSLHVREGEFVAVTGPSGSGKTTFLTIAGLLEDGARASLLVGHDDNIVAVLARLGVRLRLPGYGADDPPPGGALGFQVLRADRSGARYVRVFYQAQSLRQLRALTPLTRSRRPLIRLLHPACEGRLKELCPMSAIQGLLDRR